MHARSLSLVWLLAACSSSPPNCPGDTPGMVFCGGTECAVADCQAPLLGVDMFPPRYGAEVCVSGGKQVANGRNITSCDGPEDCPSGQQCWAREFDVACGTQGVPGYGPYCHSDCDCGSGQHCRPCSQGVGDCCS